MSDANRSWSASPRGIAFLILVIVLGPLIVLRPTAVKADFLEWITDLVSETGPELDAAVRGELALPADAIVTAPGQARMITVGKDILELYPSTAITIDLNGEKTTVNVITGTIRARVAKRDKAGLFEVQTPYLVGVVKGTVFEVATREGASALSVYEGRVGMKAIRGVGGMDITPGRTATVSMNDKGGKLGDTPPGGAAEAAKQAAKAAGFVDASAPSHAPHSDTANVSRPVKPSDVQPSGTTPSDTTEDGKKGKKNKDRDDKKDKKDKGEKD